MNKLINKAKQLNQKLKESKESIEYFSLKEKISNDENINKLINVIKNTQNDMKNHLKNNDIKSFKDLTTMKVGGKINNLYYPSSINNLMDVLNYLDKKKQHFFVIGNGSNLVASDKRYKKLVISGKHLVKSIEFFDDYFVVSGFMDLRIIIAKLVEKQMELKFHLKLYLSHQQLQT